MKLWTNHQPNYVKLSEYFFKKLSKCRIYDITTNLSQSRLSIQTPRRLYYIDVLFKAGFKCLQTHILRDLFLFFKSRVASLFQECLIPNSRLLTVYSRSYWNLSSVWSVILEQVEVKCFLLLRDQTNANFQSWNVSNTNILTNIQTALEADLIYVVLQMISVLMVSTLTLIQL